MSSSFRSDSRRDNERRRSFEDNELQAPPRYSAAASSRRDDNDARGDPGPSIAGPSVQRVYQRVDDDNSSLYEPPPPVQPAPIRIERPDHRSRSRPPPRLQPVVQPIQSGEPSGRAEYVRRREPSASPLRLETDYGLEYPRPRERSPSPLHLVTDNGSEYPQRRSNYAPSPPRGPPLATHIIIDNGRDRRSYRVPPGPPSPHRRQRSGIPMEAPRPPRERPPVRRVPPGFVQPAPYLPPSERLHSHDLTGIAQGPDPKSDPNVRENLVLCVYRNSKKSFDYRFVKLISGHGRKDAVITDLSLFHNMRYIYEHELRGWIRRFFSFKGLTTVRLLQYGAGQLFRPKQDDDLFSLTFMKFWWNPEELLLKGSVDWIEWIREAKNLHREFDMAIELIEDYIPERIVFFIGLGLIAIVALTAAWLIKGGDPGNVSTVMSFVLTFIAAVVALTTIWDHFDGGRSKEIREHAVVVLPGNFKDVPEGTPFWKPNLLNPKGKEYIKEKEDEKD